MIEIEKKFLIDDEFAGDLLCDNKEDFAFVTISDTYIPNAEPHMTLRLRKKVKQGEPGKYCITRKTLLDPNDKTSMVEQTMELNSFEYCQLRKGNGTTTVTKDRFKIKYLGHSAELDIYKGRHRGLRVLEIEFASLQEMESWLSTNKIPLKDVTNDEHYAVGKMAEVDWKM